MKALSIYIHIPFCVQKCRYCDFLSAPADAETKNKYVAALKREIVTESKNYKDYEVITVFFGGGTPSILEGSQIESIVDILKEHFNVKNDAEITLEMNPATANLEKMKKIFEAGVNRLSIGLQSANNEELKMLGRVHSFEDFLETYRLARSVGFKNINIDLMSALPGQTLEMYLNTLDKVVALGPEHISAYSLIVEENTYLCQNIERFPSLPSEEEDRNMYQTTKMKLKNSNYERYEISNYSKPGFECRHNKVYWTRGNYAGFGLGASSLVENCRWKNFDSLQDYLNENNLNLKEDVQKLTKEDQMEEFMFLGLRLMKGISKTNFKENFNVSIEDIYGKTIEKWTKLGYLIEKDDSIYFSDAGIDVSNQILSEFLF